MSIELFFIKGNIWKQFDMNGILAIRKEEILLQLQQRWSGKCHTKQNQKEKGKTSGYLSEVIDRKQIKGTDNVPEKEVLRLSHYKEALRLPQRLEKEMLYRQRFWHLGRM